MSIPVAAFCAFAQPDQPSCLQLERALKPAQRQGVLTLWHEGHIPGGVDRTEAIENHLVSDTFILLLISPDFLASDECDALAQRAWERHRAGQAQVIPILLHPADMQGSPIAELAPLPTTLRPISKWRNKDEAFADVVAGIRRTIADLGQLGVGQTGQAQRFPQVWTVPYPRNALFTGREDLHVSCEATMRRSYGRWARRKRTNEQTRIGGTPARA